MYKLPDTALAAADVAELRSLQDAVNAQATYGDRVNEASARFGTKPRALFQKVRGKLAEMSGDLVRCSYCEDSCADEVEHIRPKDFYPEFVFEWNNYLFACGVCNRSKQNHYPILVNGARTCLHTARKADGVVQPPAGTPYFIDPRVEQPLSYIWLDILGRTFMFSPLADDGSFSEARANETIEILRLNREPLRKARENAYGGYRDRLAQLAARKAEGAPPEEIEARLADIARSPHRTVWLEMKRQRQIVSEIGNLILIVPEVNDL